MTKENKQTPSVRPFFIKAVAEIKDGKQFPYPDTRQVLVSSDSVTSIVAETGIMAAESGALGRTVLGIGGNGVGVVIDKSANEVQKIFAAHGYDFVS